MTAAPQGCQPANPELRQEVAAIHRVGEIVVELNDCGFESAIDLIDTLTKQRDAAEYRIEELTKALKATREQLIKVRDASPEIRNHELEINRVIAHAWHTLNDTGVAIPLEQSGSGK